MGTRQPDITVTCYVRPSLLLEPVDSHVRTLRAAEEEGEIDALLLRSWPDQITISADRHAPESLEAFEEFTEWAYREGVEIEPPFAVQTRESTITGESRTVLVTPVCCLAVYVGNALAGVYPHVDGEESRTVTDAVAALRSGEIREATTDVAGATVGDCPRCDGGVINGQGVYSCLDPDCEWVGLQSDGTFVALDRPGERVLTSSTASPTERQGEGTVGMPR